MASVGAASSALLVRMRGAKERESGKASRAAVATKTRVLASLLDRRMKGNARQATPAVKLEGKVVQSMEQMERRDSNRRRKEEID